MIARDLPRFRAPALWLALLTAGLTAAGTATAQLRMPGTAPGTQPAPTAPAPSAAVRPADYIVAVVNSEPITNNEVRARVARVQQQIAQQRMPQPPRAELARQVLEQLIGERAQLQLARESGIKVDESLVDQAEQNVARQNQIDVRELRRRLGEEGISAASFREDLRNQLLLSRLRDREIEPRVKISESELDQFIREQQNSTDLSAMELNLAHVLVAVPEGASPAMVAELQAKARRIQERAKAGEDFSALARESSDASGAATNGGVIGMRSADRYPPLFVQATRNLGPGAVSEVVRSAAGFHVIKVIEKKRAGEAGTTVVQHRARHILLRPSAQLSESAALQRLADYKKRIESGQADFEQLAREHSQDGSARNGGDLGWANPGMFVPEFEEVLESLQPGQIADPLVSRFGVHLIQLVDRRQQALSPREQRELARARLREKKLQEAYVQWAQDVRGRAYVELREPPQ